MLAPLSDPDKILKRPDIPVPTWNEWLEKQQMPQRTAQETGQLAPLQAEVVEEPPQQTPPRSLSPLEVQTNRYNQAVQSKPNKQGWGAQAAWWAMQGLNKIFNPQDDTPVQYLGEAKRQKRIAMEGQKLAPLQAQDQFQRQQAYDTARTGTILNDDKRQDQAAKDLAKYRADTAASNAEEIKRRIEKDERTRQAKRKMYLNTNQRKRDEIQASIAEIEIETKATEAALAKDIADLGKTPPNKKAEITRLKSAIARKQDKLRERSGDIEKHKKRQAAIVDVEDGELADAPNAPVNEDLMKSIRANAPQGATEEQIRAAYLRALNE